MSMAMFVPLTIERRPAFEEDVLRSTGEPLRAASIRTVQVNIGLRCNLACRHCHVESSPSRTEEMDWPTMMLVLEATRRAGAETLDITGGAPEMHPRFREFVTLAREGGLRVMVRSNLTILLEPGYENLPDFFAAAAVEVVASLPCYLEENVDRQRGRRVFAGSIEALRRLNAVGYGIDERLVLTLVYNPLGPQLPPPQAKLEEAYRLELRERFGLRFTRLHTIANMPIGRFQHDLARAGQDQRYLAALRQAFNWKTLDGLMCRHQLHVGHDGMMYDCDFNYALALPVRPEAGRHLRDFDPAVFAGRAIATGEHCYGCTAGNGSSCSGALA